MSARGHLPRPITSTLSFGLQGAHEKGQGGHTTAVPLPGGHHLPLPKLTSHELPPPRGAPCRVPRARHSPTRPPVAAPPRPHGEPACGVLVTWTKAPQEAREGESCARAGAARPAAAACPAWVSRRERQGPASCLDTGLGAQQGRQSCSRPLRGVWPSRPAGAPALREAAPHHQVGTDCR